MDTITDSFYNNLCLEYQERLDNPPEQPRQHYASGVIRINSRTATKKVRRHRSGPCTTRKMTDGERLLYMKVKV